MQTCKKKANSIVCSPHYPANSFHHICKKELNKMVKRTCSWLVKKKDWLHEPPYLCRAPDKK